MAIAFLVLVSAPADAQRVRAGFVYSLANFTGTIPYNHSRVVVDKQRNEIYVMYGATVWIFNEFGMEIFHFGDDLDLGLVADIAVNEEGDILLLTYKDSQGAIIRCNYRGEPKSRIDLKNLPREFSDFSPNRMVYQAGRIYLLSTMGMKIVIADREGNFSKSYDLAALLELKVRDLGNVEIAGFSVDREANILLTIPALFSAYVLPPDGKLKFFGKPGAAPGRFNVVAGIARDSKGNFLVVDKLKGSVLVFDKAFNFVNQFGSYGRKRGELVAPDDIAVDSGDKVYVTQAAGRGVSVYQLSLN